MSAILNGPLSILFMYLKHNCKRARCMLGLQHCVRSEYLHEAAAAEPDPKSSMSVIMRWLKWLLSS